MKIIERTDYLESLQNVRLTPDIKVITGIRRAGKSELIRTYMEWLRKNDKKANIIFIDFTSLTAEPLQEYHALHNYIEEQYKAKKNNYVFIDEVQMCAKFELAINSLHAMQKYDIYITGSNAFLLGSDLATLFTGRVMRTMVYPFSFSEYRTYFGPQEIQSQLDQYIQDGGLAGSYVYATQAEKVRYVQEVFHTIIERDIIQRYKLSDVYLLNKIAEYLMDNIGNTTSYRSVSGFLQSEHIKTNHVTVGNYMDFLCRTFLFNQVKRYDVRGKGYLRMIDKYYLVDSGFRYALLGIRNMDYGRIYENLVALELLRRGYDIYVGKLYQKEIDFVAMRGNEKIYIQVSNNISAKETFEREYSPLLQIKDVYPKFIIARTRVPKYDYQGIQIIDLAEWLLSEDK
ncbi:MAG: ATP-binding protein [Paludibacteraceae bacterium]|nr:ATP-binding protein [Paludibacteraceae bacterium]